MHCSPPGSSAHGIFQARISESGAISYSRVYSCLKDQTCVPCTSGIGRPTLYHYCHLGSPKGSYVISTKSPKNTSNTSEIVSSDVLYLCYPNVHHDLGDLNWCLRSCISNISPNDIRLLISMNIEWKGPHRLTRQRKGMVFLRDRPKSEGHFRKWSSQNSDKQQ